MIRLYIEPEAEEELDQSADRYEASFPGLGQAFVTEMRRRVSDVLEAPLSFPVFGDADDVRCAHAVGRFPHLVVFMLVGDTVSPAVHVLAFIHPPVSCFGNADPSGCCAGLTCMAGFGNDNFHCQ
jgi:hypothetical protein